jgi:histidine triad (HIT) family protein
MDIFCKIINKEIPSNIVVENDHFICIKDIKPQAKIHLLIIPKKHYENVYEFHCSDMAEKSSFYDLVKVIADKFGIQDNFVLTTNNGSKVGQVVFHLHWHLMSN